MGMSRGHSREWVRGAEHPAPGPWRNVLAGAGQCGREPHLETEKTIGSHIHDMTVSLGEGEKAATRRQSSRAGGGLEAEGRDQGRLRSPHQVRGSRVWAGARGGVRSCAPQVLQLALRGCQIALQPAHLACLRSGRGMFNCSGKGQRQRVTDVCACPSARSARSLKMAHLCRLRSAAGACKISKPEG